MRILFLVLMLCASVASAQKVGLVLSGGGARGLAHVGVIKALEENNIPIDYITGTSMGAMVGGLYAAGYSPAQLEAIVSSEEFQQASLGILDDDYQYYFKRKEDNASVISLKITHDSLWQTRLPIKIINPVPVDFALMEYLSGANAISHYNFDSLFVPFRCVAADIETKQQVIWGNGNLGEAIRSSMAFPFYFTPVISGEKMLFDGGLYNNFPADIMVSSFHPDFVIGSNVSTGRYRLDEENLISLLRTMVVNRVQHNLLPDKAVILDPKVSDYDLFEFDKAKEIINAGYTAAMEQIRRIKSAVPRESDPKELENRRKAFTSSQPALVVDNIDVRGLTREQSEYVRRILRPKKGSLSFSRFKRNYFRLAADGNIKRMFPRLVYNPATKMYDLQLDVKREKGATVQFGGNFSSRPISEAFAAVQYNIWRRQSLSINANTYFGKLYNSGQVKLRFDIPSRLPFYMEHEFVLNQWDYFKSSSIVLEDIRPSYLIYTDKRYGMSFGIPARTKGKAVLGGAIIDLNENYYQTPDFNIQDTSDETRFAGSTAFFLFERYTMNRKLYPNDGTFLSFKVRYVDGVEELLPGSTSASKELKSAGRKWYQARFVYENYYKRRGRLKLGLYTEAVYSNQPLFFNYASTLLTAPAFQPVSDSRTIFLEMFRAHSYAGLGSQNVLSIKRTLDLRMEGYIFQPHREILKDASTNTAYYGGAFSKRHYMASLAMIYHTPIGPASISVNYYDKERNPVSILFHFGYIMYNKKALE